MAEFAKDGLGLSGESPPDMPPVGFMRSYVSRIAEARQHAKSSSIIADELHQGFLKHARDPQTSTFHLIPCGNRPLLIAVTPVSEHFDPSKNRNPSKKGMRRVTLNQSSEPSVNSEGQPVHTLIIRDIFIDLKRYEVRDDWFYHDFENNTFMQILPDDAPVILFGEKGYELHEPDGYIWTPPSEKESNLYPSQRMADLDRFNSVAIELNALFVQLSNQPALDPLASF